MSKKFIRVLGISLIIILLPVLIVSTVIALDHQEEKPKDQNSDPTYSVKGEYGSATQVSYDEESDTWTLKELPTRDFYIFRGVAIDGVDGVFAVNTENEIEISIDKKDEFKTAVLADKQIETVWTCKFSDIRIETGSNWEDKGDGFSGSVTDWGGSMDAIEKINLLDLVNFDYETYPITRIQIKTLTAEGTYVKEPVTISYDTDVNGDLSISDFLSMIAAKNIPLNTIEPNVLKIMLYNT